MSIVLPSLGLPLSYPRTVLHAPDDSMGYQLPCLDVDAGFFQVELFLRHVYGDKVTGRLGHDTLEMMQLELGVGQDPFTLDYSVWKVLATPCWMARVWEFCSEYGFAIKVPRLTILLLREGDCFIMATFVAAGYTGEELRLLNICRLWHKVLRLSELVTGDGKFIRAEARLPGPAIGRNDFHWPEEHKPSPRCWKLWNQALDKCFVDPLSRNKQLASPRGKWTSVPSKWEWFILPEENRLYRVQNQQVTLYSSTQRMTRRPRYVRRGRVPSRPAESVPTTCFGNESGPFRHEGFSLFQPIHDELGVSQWWNRRILGTAARLPLFFEGVRQGTAVIVCDGSFKDTWGTAAVIAAPSLESLEPVISTHLTPGPLDQHNPYRAELAGILAGVISVEKECTQFGVTSGTITVGCDCDGALQVFQDCLQYRPSARGEHYDLKSQLYDLLQHSNFTWKAEQVKGHQDDWKDYDQLTVWEQWNVDADFFAKAEWATHIDTLEPYQLPPLQEASIWYGDERLTTWNDKEVYRRVFAEDATKYWHNRLGVEHPDRIAFDVMGQTFKGWLIYKRLWLSKALTERLPTSQNVSKWSKEEVPDMCPRCGEAEDAIHATWCQAPAAQGFRQERLNKLEEFLRRQHTAPSLRRRIMRLLKGEVPPSGNSVVTKELVLQGILPQSWIESQQQYYTWLKRRTTGKRWAMRLIVQLWEISWDMWDHRTRIFKSKDAAHLVQHHENLNHRIQTEYQSQHDNPNRLLIRRFSRPLPYCMSQDVHWKQQWLDAVTKIRAAHAESE